MYFFCWILDKFEGYSILIMFLMEIDISMIKKYEINKSAVRKPEASSISLEEVRL